MKLLKSYLVIIMLLLGGTTISASTLIVTNDDITITLDVKDAYYTDFENTGEQNDIIAEYSAVISVTKELHNDYKYDIHTRLTLPSGMSFAYTFDRTVPAGTTMLEMSFMIVFYDHALESGWYELTTGIELYQWGHKYGDISIIFDPPEGGGDAPPPAEIIDS